MTGARGNNASIQPSRGDASVATRPPDRCPMKRRSQRKKKILQYLISHSRLLIDSQRRDGKHPDFSPFFPMLCNLLYRSSFHSAQSILDYLGPSKTGQLNTIISPHHHNSNANFDFPFISQTYSDFLHWLSPARLQSHYYCQRQLGFERGMRDDHTFFREEGIAPGVNRTLRWTDGKPNTGR